MTEVRCPTLYSKQFGAMPCGRRTVVVERFEWGGRNIEVHRCPKGHLTEWAAPEEEQG